MAESEDWGWRMRDRAGGRRWRRWVGPAAIVAALAVVITMNALPPPPQARQGDGWRLLTAEKDVGGVWETEFLNSEGALRRFWADEGLSGPVPDVDWASEAVLFFGPAVSSECPDVRLRDVGVRNGVVYPETEVVDEEGDGCTDDANPFTFLVAVDRAVLPDTPFSVELLDNACEEVPGVCAQQRTTVTEQDLEGVPLLEVDDWIVDQVMGAWWNNTGLARDDPVVWRERISEMCHRGETDHEVALELAAVYLAEDEPVSVRADGVPPVSPSAAGEALVLPAGSCGSLDSGPGATRPTVIGQSVAAGLPDSPACSGGGYATEDFMIAEDARGAPTPEAATDSAIRHGLGDPTYQYTRPSGEFRVWWLSEKGDVIGVGDVLEVPAGGWVLVSISYCG